VTAGRNIVACLCQRLCAILALVSAPLACAPAAACPRAEVSRPPPVAAELKFDWPTTGRMVVECRTADGETIEIPGRDDAEVRAAQSGLVLFAGEFKGYGDLVLIRHQGGFVSATYGQFAHLRVKRGDAVGKGEPIAAMRPLADSPALLRFELRRGAQAVDARPLMSAPLPPSELAATN